MTLDTKGRNEGITYPVVKCLVGKMEHSVNTTPLLGDDHDSDDEQFQHEFNRDDNKPLFKPLEPRDKFNTAYLIFCLLGIVSLLPWNFYVTADDYWMYKFRNVSKNESMVGSSTSGRTPLQAEFTSYLSLASSVPNLVFLVLTTAISHRVSLNVRVVGSLFVMLLLMLVTLVFIQVDTDKWQQTFFGVTLISIILLNVCSAIFSGSLFGAVGKFSPKYITAVIGGQALGGVFAALAQIASLSIGASSTHSALVYFIIGNLTIAISIFLYIMLEKSLFFKYYIADHAVINELLTNSLPMNYSYRTILKKMWCYGLSIFVTFAVSLAVYPGVTVLIDSEGKGHGNRWNDVYFVPTIAYLLFSTGDYLGRILAGKVLKPRNITVLVILSCARFIFIPLLMLCNAQPRHLAVVFDRDYQYILILFLFAVSNGYLANIATIMVPK
nr:equilibrative nucleoside transporter 3-like [Leptinotarsa decemlineata]